MKSSPSKVAKRTPSVSEQLVTASTAATPINILVPVDFSQPSGFALLAAADFARQYGGQITLVTVVEPDLLHVFETNLLAVRRKTLERRLKTELSEFGHKLVGKGQVEAILVRNGKPFEQIVNVARTLKTDLIVIATHGHTGLKHMLLGSTAERVIRYAPCAVLTVRSEKQQGWPAIKK
jgi:nucleotide-binding universal stress UspA family protein